MPGAAHFNPGAYSSTATAAAPDYEPASDAQHMPDFELFSRLYRDSDQDYEDEERPRRFDYRIVLLILVLAGIVLLGYRQRNNAKALYLTARQSIAAQFGELWGEQQQAAPSAKSTSAEPQVRNRTRAKATNRRSAAKSDDATARRPQTVFESRPPSPLRVQVQGQPGPDLISYVPRRPLAAFLGDVGGPGPAVSTSSSAPAPFAVSITPRESLSLLLKQVPPIYPANAREVRAEGPVVLKAIIHKDGNVGDLTVVSGNPLLTQAAIEAVRQWVYRPYYRGGEPMEVETLVVVDFSVPDRAEVGARRHLGN